MNGDIRFRSIKETAILPLGLSEHYLREGVKAGWIPHIKAGCKVLINVPKLMAILDQESDHKQAE